MGELVISTHDFEESKRKIQQLSGKVPSKVNFNKFPTEGNWIPWLDHKVTGKEINDDLVVPLQSTIRSLKSSILGLFTISNEVYRAFEALDKDYIQGILIGVKSAEEASDQAKKASDQAKKASTEALEASKEAKKASAEALEASDKASKAQDDIKKTIDALQITVSSLKHFKETITSKLDSLETSNKSGLENLHRFVDDLPAKIEIIQNELQSYKHLADVDSTWEEVQSHKSDLSQVHQLVSEMTSKADEATEKINADLTALQHFQSLMQSYSHLNDVDTTWEDVQAHKVDLSEVQQRIKEITRIAAETTDRIHEDLSALQQFQTLLQSYSHLCDVDSLWADVQEHTTDLSEVHDQISEISSKVAETTEKIHADLSLLQQFQTQLQSYSHLSDVDATWEDVQAYKKDLSDVHQEIDEITSKAAETTKKIHADLALFQQFQTQLQSYSHLSDVDATWEDVQAHKKDLSDVHQEIDRITSKTAETTKRIHADLATLQQFQSQLQSYSHLNDVDTIWDMAEDSKTGLSNCHQTINNLAEEFHVSSKDLRSSIDMLDEDSKQRDLKVNKKLKIAYFIAGFSLVMTVIQFILRIFGIL